MIFSEVYSAYFNVASQAIKCAVCGKLTDKEINEIVFNKAFGESILNIPQLLKNGSWKLIDENFETPIKNIPDMPLTLLQKRWLKAILNDKRIKLFNPVVNGLDDVEPLYQQKDIVYFDRYTDGDDFENPEYINIFQTILKALNENKKIKVKYSGKQWKEKEFICSPIKLEYSSKNDRFRLMTVAFRKIFILNLSRISRCEITDFEIDDRIEDYADKKGTLELLLKNEKNALERFMLAFSHLEKKAERLNDNTYRILLKYDKTDETEMLIRILSFGARVKVIAPQSFVNQMKNRIEKQADCEVL